MTSPVRSADPVRVAIVGLTHDHVFWLLGRPRDRGDIEIVAVYEPNEGLAHRRMDEFGLDRSLHYRDLDRLLADARPEAVCLFGSTLEHHAHGLKCLRAGVHTMVEKPLAVSLSHARELAEEAERSGVHLLTNYETTWYASHAELRRRVDAGLIGAPRRFEYRTGHRGPIEIGCRPEFLEWLLDPERNGGGAVTDFGCYGVNLTTWLMDGSRPESVWATTRRIKPNLYPDVDDDATIVLNYPEATAVVQASWNWPRNLKQTHVHGVRGSLTALDSDRLLLEEGKQEARAIACPAPDRGSDDPFAHLAAVVRGDAAPNALSSVENNLIVVEVLDAARLSAETGERIALPAGR